MLLSVLKKCEHLQRCQITTKNSEYKENPSRDRKERLWLVKNCEIENQWMPKCRRFSVGLTLRLVSLIYANGGQGNANERVSGGRQTLASLDPLPGTLSTSRRSLHSSWVQ